MLKWLLENLGENDENGMLIHYDQQVLDHLMRIEILLLKEIDDRDIEQDFFQIIYKDQKSLMLLKHKYRKLVIIDY